MHFGVSKEIITPTFRTEMACTGVFDDTFKNIHDDVYVRCLILDDEKERIILMSFDLLFHDRLLNKEMEEYAKEKYGINPDGVIVSYTHAHTTVASRGYNPGSETQEYEEMLVECGKKCIDRAMLSMIEGTMEYGSFDCDFNISRRGVIDGEYRNAPNYNYDHDSECFVMCLRDTEGNIRSVVTNYGCHPVFYPATLSVSGEFPARLCQLIDARYYGCTSLYFQSAGGDVRPKPTAGEDGKFINVMPFSVVDRFAKDIEKAVVDFIERGNIKKTDLSIKADSFEMEMEMEPAPLSYFEEMQKAYGDAMHPMARNARIINAEKYPELEKSLFLKCQAVRLSNSLYIATMGGKPCCRVKKIVTEAFDDKAVMFIGYTDACAYIVDDQMLEEGGYEPTCHLEYCLIGPFKSGLDVIYRDGFRKSFEKVK